MGYTLFSCGLSAYSMGLFHLITHASFKALLFLTAGAVIHSMANEQDVRRLGSLRQLLPFTYVMMLIGSLALTGFPFLSGFYSKEGILEVAYTHYIAQGCLSYWCGLMGSVITTIYSWRLLYITFLGPVRGKRTNYVLAIGTFPCYHYPTSIISYR
jgi:NADH-ubiquinone oxidoreductase chain 5